MSQVLVDTRCERSLIDGRKAALFQLKIRERRTPLTVMNVDDARNHVDRECICDIELPGVAKCKGMTFFCSDKDLGADAVLGMDFLMRFEKVEFEFADEAAAEGGGHDLSVPRLSSLIICDNKDIDQSVSDFYK